nr:dof zinc finger protein DOF4.5-like [Ipomoea batatas]
MEQGNGVGDYHSPLPSVRRLRTMEYPGSPPPPRQCPCCHSGDTKFCYFNNYNKNQPRYYCRACKRHWTHGGIQRDIPIGGKSHKGRKSTNRRWLVSLSAEKAGPHSSRSSTKLQLSLHPPSTGLPVKNCLGRNQLKNTHYATIVAAATSRFGLDMFLNKFTYLVLIADLEFRDLERAMSE